MRDVRPGGGAREALAPGELLPGRVVLVIGVGVLGVLARFVFQLPRDEEAQGVVRSRRDGKMTMYALTGKGSALLAALEAGAE